MSELYFSLDVETDGPIAPLNSMIQIGLTAFNLTRCPIAQYTASLLPLPGAVEDPDTLRWWMETEEKKARWSAIRINAKPAEVVMPEVMWWIAAEAAKEKAEPICCASPVGYDWCFFRYYTIRYAYAGQESIFRHRCWDARSHAMGILGKEYLHCGKEGVPQSWRPKELPHTHDAGDDSIEQAVQFQRQMQAAIDQRLSALAWAKLAPMAKGVSDLYNQTRQFIKENL
jgi:hypothetical protein